MHRGKGVIDAIQRVFPKSSAVILLAMTVGLLLLSACTGESDPGPDSVPASTTTAPTTPVSPVPTATPALTPAPSVPQAPLPTVFPSPTAVLSQTTTPAPIPTPATTSTPESDADPVGIAVPPRRDLYELARSLRHKLHEPIPYLRHQTPTDLQTGQTDTFKVLANVEPVEFREINAKLEHISPNAYWYVQEGMRFDGESLAEAATVFEERILPGLQSSFGPLWGPDDLAGQRLTILHATTRGLAGYFSSADQYPVQVHENSNQRKMIYLNPASLRIGTETYLSVLAHELQHAVNWNLNGGQSTWINEGLSQVAENRLGWRPNSVEPFVHSVPTSLVYWPLTITQSRPYYGSSFMFTQFMTEQVGSPANLETLLRADYRGIPAVNEFLKSLGTGETFETIFERWTVAGYLSEKRQTGPYGYSNWWPSIDPTDTLIGDGTFQFSQPQYSARYLLLDSEAESADLHFAAWDTVAVAPQDPPTGGHCWWGNHGDTISTTLTREFDLSSLQQATLSYTAWYSIEEDWDYAYVQVSTDGGSTWDVLQGSLSSTDNPSLNSYGPGYTGESRGWVSDSVDLTPYAGNTLLVRFHYVTDDALTGPGICIDAMSIPELGFYDDASVNQGWVSEGFYRTDNRMPQDFAVHLVEIREDDVTVTPVALDENNRGSLSIQNLDDVDEAVLVVGSLAENSQHPASYTVTLETKN